VVIDEQGRGEEGGFLLGVQEWLGERGWGKKRPFLVGVF